MSSTPLLHDAPAFSAPPLPTASGQTLPPLARRAAVLGVLAAHVAGGWALMQVESVRQAVGQVAPIMVELIAPPAPPVPLPPPPPPAPTPVKPLPKPVPTLVTTAPSPAPAVFEAPPPVEPPQAIVIEPAPAPPAPPAPAPAPAPAAQPKTIAITQVGYLKEPVLVYPATSRRFGESGEVHVRVLVDAEGKPREMQMLRSSGHSRLDESALATVRATRFKPYTENGVAQPFWVVMPLAFELQNQP